MTRTLLTLCLAASACHGLQNDADARYAYLGLDDGVQRALGLGLQGFSLASSANIDAQQADGDAGGTMVVTGQVDQGASDNKELRLDVALVDYQDAVPDDNDDAILTVYNTDTTAPLALDLSLRNIPDGTLTGTLTGLAIASDDLAGDVVFDLALAGAIEADPDVTDGVRMVAGSTHVTGTATSDYGTYDVDVTR